MRRLIFSVFILFPTLIYADTLTITTYYPSPYGSYRELRSKRISIGDTYYDSATYCWAPDSCTYQIDTNADLVVEGNVGIGSTSPGSKLVIRGGSDSSTSSLNVVNSSYTSALFVRDDGNVGIATTSPPSTFSVGNSNQFRVNSSGNLIRINNVVYSWPASQGAANSGLTSDASGNLSWTAGAGVGSGWTDDGGVVRLTTSGDSVGIGTTNPGTYKLYVTGDVYVNRIYTGDSSTAHGTSHTFTDVAEDILAGDCEPTDVVVIDPNTNEKVIKSTKPYDQSVAGIISEAPAFYIGKQTKKGYQPLALAGRVYCKVSLENGPIKRGDFLTTSSIPGHAMKATDKEKSPGAIVAKALDNFSGAPEEGQQTGRILVLVVLQ